MELIEGESPKGPLPLETALDYARQIAAALEAAHDRGIVHRDLKPGNIKVTPQGVVKVLDFGLAKSVLSDSSKSFNENSPTFSMAATQAGMILGTAAYMAPEQARGMVVDKRADIWAFGVVLYEMLTGKRLFQGEDLTDTLAAVVRDKPDLSAAPEQIRPVLEKCLEKDPRKRLRDISGVQLLLDAGTPAQTSVKVRASKWPLAVAASALLFLAALAFVHFREAPPERSPAVMFSLDAPPETVYANQYGGFAVSPDGRYVVLEMRSKGSPSLWLRSLDSITARPLAGTEEGNFPTWSPDSRSLAFAADGKIKRIEIAGGAPLTLGEEGISGRVTPTGTWNRDGVILFGNSSGLMRVSASGGGAVPLTKVDHAKKEIGHGYPQFLPDGDRFLFFIDSNVPENQGIYSSSLRNPEQRKQILRTAAKAVYIPPREPYPGYLLWMQERTLLAQRFNADALKLEGDPVSVAEDIGLNPTNLVRAAFWASDSGLLVYFASPSLTKRPVVWIDRDGKQTDAAPDDVYGSLALSPKSDRMAISRTEAGSGRGNSDIWVREFERGVMTRLTFDAAEEGFPIWSPDGKQLAFASRREGGVFQIYRKDATGTGTEERLTEGGNPKIPLDWSKDGKYILYREDTSTNGRDLMALPLTGDRKPITVVSTPFNESTAAISPDGRWVAYASNESASNELYVQAFPGDPSAPKGRWQISNKSAYEVKWRGDGKELYYQTNDGRMMAATIQAGPDGIRADTPREVFSADFPNGGLQMFDVTPDAKRFLMILNARTGSNSERLTVLSNWQAALRK
jgi:Tol biopolymer transport system component